MMLECNADMRNEPVSAKQDMALFCRGCAHCTEGGEKRLSSQQRRIALLEPLRYLRLSMFMDC